MDKQEIVRELQRVARETGKVPGWKRFQDETGIRYYDWFGKHWARWGDLVQEAGLTPNQLAQKYPDEFLIEKLVRLTIAIGKVPAKGDVQLAGRRDPDFPYASMERLGRKSEVAHKVISYCEDHPEFSDAIPLWLVFASKQIPGASFEGDTDEVGQHGYVYLVRHGSRSEYKIGRTNNPLRRDGEIAIELPEKAEPVHRIKTDDPAGIESYWHNRFKDKRKNGEWFQLNSADVAAFKRWRRIH